MTKPMNILFLMTDQQRADFIGDYTPHINWIGEGSDFRNCITVNPICTPARTALLTGRYSRQIGTLAMSGDLSPQIPTYMQALRKSGYYTAGVGKFHFLQTWPWQTARGKGIPLKHIKEKMKAYGFDYIWEASGKQLMTQNHCDYAEYLYEKGLLESYRDFVESSGPNGEWVWENHDQAKHWPFERQDYVDTVIGENILKALKNRPRDKSFCLFGSFCGPHRPYDSPEEDYKAIPPENEVHMIPFTDGEISEDQKKRIEKQRRSSKAMLSLIDGQIGRILDYLKAEGELDRTVIFFTSDHGDMLGDHGRIQKGLYWKESVNVPLLIRHPRLPGGNRIDKAVENIDISATILDCAGLNPENALSADWPEFNNLIPSRSLVPLMKNGKSGHKEFAYSECNNQWEMIQKDQWKFIRRLGSFEIEKPRMSLYNLENDKDERNDLSSLKEMKERIQSFEEMRVSLKDSYPPCQTSWAPLM